VTDASVSAPEPRGLLGHRLLIVTGKGGTGKSTVAATIATVAAREGRRVLLCDMDAKGSATVLLGAGPGPVGFDPVELAPGLFAMSMDTERALREYLRLFSPVPLAGTLGPVAGVIDFVADAAPGVREILVIGKVCWEVRRGEWDVVIVDAEASGHIVSQIAAPRVLGDLVTAGLIRDQTEWMLGILEDPAVTAAVAVTTPEEMPVTETIETVGRIRGETGTSVHSIIVNRMPSPLVQPGDRELLATVAGRDRAVADAATVLVWADGRRREAERLCEELAEGCPGAAIAFLPESSDPSPERLADTLADEIGGAG